MTPQDLKDWRARLGWTKVKAARDLGLGYRTYNQYEAGQRSDGYSVEIPLTVALACAALEHRLPPVGGPPEDGA